VATGSSTMQDALENLGVRPDTLTPGEKDQLDHAGFLPLGGILTPDELGSLRARVDELLQAEGDQAGTEFRQEAGTERLSDLVNKGAVFDVCFTHPRVLAGIAHVLAADFKLSSLNYGRPCRDRAIRRSTPTGVSQSPLASFGSVTRSGSWTTSPQRMDQRAWCRARTSAARCRKTRCRTRPSRIRTR
jgi:hypothetical protein